MDKAKNKSARSDLMQALDFSHEDLVANRAGKLSADQRFAIQREGCGYHILYGISLAVMLVISGVVLMTTPGHPFSPVAIFCFALTGVVLMGWWRIYRDYRNRLEHTGVKTVLSMIRKQVADAHSRQPGYWLILLDGREFRVDVHTFNALVENRDYYLYLDSHSNQLISAEPALSEHS